MGVERKSLLLSDEEKKNTAYHEAGHALVAAKLPHSDPAAQGDDHPSRHGARRHHAAAYRTTGTTITRTISKPQIAILMGGRLAEECSSTDEQPAPATTSNALPNWPARWSASGA